MGFLFLLVIAFLFAAVIGKLSLKKQQPKIWDAGSIGEHFVRQALLPLEGYKKLLSNCYLPKSDGTFTEIDVILLHESGIYVVESKNYSGWIFGKDYEQYWTQSLGGKKSQRSRFFNPIIQNSVHIKWLREYIGEGFPIYSYIVFGDRCELKKITVTKPGYFVTNCHFLLQSVQNNAVKAGKTLSPKAIDSLYKKLYPLTQVTEEQKIQHIQTVQANQEEQHTRPVPTSPSEPSPEPLPMDKERRCPRCGGRLVLRTAKKGERAGKEFWGCSNYPRCRFVENVEETVTV